MLAVAEAAERGVFLVSAAGNNKSTVEWPAAYPAVLAVAATDANDARASFSNFGSEIDVAAPGTDIVSTHLLESFKPLSGTSMATPHVAALAGLIMSLRPDYTADQIKAVLRDTAEDVNAAAWPGDDSDIGAGRINFYQALLAASSGVKIHASGEVNTAMVGQLLDYAVRVSVPAGDNDSLDVTGAVMYYEIVPDGQTSAGSISATAATTLNRSVTQGGMASFSIAAPATAGDYLVRTLVGQAVEEFPLTVFGSPISITLAFSTTEVAVGEHQTPFQITIWQDDNTLATDALPLHLETSLGSFDNGAKSLDITVTGGEFAGMFRSGSTAGMATITASVGRQSTQEQILLLAGPPSQLLGPTDPLPVFDGLVSSLVSLSFSIVDQYGNPVTDGIPIQVYASVGEIVPAALATVNGAVTTALAIPAGQTGAVVVWALVPGTASKPKSRYRRCNTPGSLSSPSINGPGVHRTHCSRKGDRKHRSYNWTIIGVQHYFATLNSVSVASRSRCSPASTCSANTSGSSSFANSLSCSLARRRNAWAVKRWSATKLSNSAARTTSPSCAATSARPAMPSIFSQAAHLPVASAVWNIFLPLGGYPPPAPSSPGPAAPPVRRCSAPSPYA